VPLFLELAVSLIVVASCLQDSRYEKGIVCWKKLVLVPCASILGLTDLAHIVPLKRCFF
jgi:hypothetical protein